MENLQDLLFSQCINYLKTFDHLDYTNINQVSKIVEFALELIKTPYPRQYKKKKYWESEFVKQRRKGFFVVMFPILLRDARLFLDYFRMKPTQFEYLVQLVAPLIIRTRVTRSRTPISVDERLALTIKYLASGDSQKSLAFEHSMGFSTVSTIIFETCTALWLKLQPIVLPTPTINDWLRIAKGFEDRWNFHHCIGAIDGKHVQIQAPPNAGSRYFNYKGFHSLVLLGVCDHRYCFTLVDIGANGRQSDGGVFFRSKIGRYFEEKSLKVPPPSKIEKTETILPYILVGDKAFPLSDYLLRPYTQQSNMEEKQLIFNYRLGRARRVIENTFGILCSRWRILRRPILGKRATIKAIIKATVCLHNFLMINKDNNSNCDSTINQVSTNEGAIQHYVGSEDSSLNMNPLSEIPLCSSAERLRDQFAEFFQEEGAVQWQFRHIYL